MSQDVTQIDPNFYDAGFCILLYFRESKRELEREKEREKENRNEKRTHIQTHTKTHLISMSLHVFNRYLSDIFF